MASFTGVGSHTNVGWERGQVGWGPHLGQGAGSLGCEVLAFGLFVERLIAPHTTVAAAWLVFLLLPIHPRWQEQ